MNEITEVIKSVTPRRGRSGVGAVYTHGTDTKGAMIYIFLRKVVDYEVANEH